MGGKQAKTNFPSAGTFKVHGKLTILHLVGELDAYRCIILARAKHITK
jgi:hypothetical protein